MHDTVATTTGGLHDLVLRNPAFGNTTALEQALGLQPTFATIWIGNNDALGAALAGRVIEGVTLTPLAAFEADLRTIVGALAQRPAKRQRTPAPRPDAGIMHRQHRVSCVRVSNRIRLASAALGP